MWCYYLAVWHRALTHPIIQSNIMTHEVIKEAIMRANRMGARGIQVVDYQEPQTASDEDRLMLIMQIPPVADATDQAWYEKH